jgi:hypothetical protein
MPTLASLSLGVLLGGTVLAIGIPSLIRNLSASKLLEATKGLEHLSVRAIAYAETKPPEISFPPSAPLTPAVVPRGQQAVDPPDAWSHLTWHALSFRFDHAHSFSFAWDSRYDPAVGRWEFVARSHGDLDGDGALSTFEVRGVRDWDGPPRVVPGLYVWREVE